MPRPARLPAVAMPRLSLEEKAMYNMCNQVGRFRDVMTTGRV
jgi:hypothetical protein